MKIIQITDIHQVAPGERIFDLDPAERLAACLADVATNHADADLCVVTGDLAHHGDTAAYQVLRDQLASFPVPVQLLLGNHDDRGVFREVFPETPIDEYGFVQSVMDTPAGRLIFLDTLELGTHAGRYCEARLRWLKARLGEAQNRPVYLFMHHQPFSLSYPMGDALMMMNGAEFMDALEGHQIRHLFFGHIHRPVAGSCRGIPFTALRGLSHQVWLDFTVVRGFTCSQEPPAYAIAFLESGSVIVHTHDFLDRSPKYFYDPDQPVALQVRPWQQAFEE